MKHSKSVKKFFAIFVTLIMSTALYAQAGTSLFVYGKVQVRTNSGQISELTRNMQINTGDTVLTGINGRAQLRMDDGAIFDLKPNTEFLIEEYIYNPASSSISGAVAEKENKGFYRLVRGGFRAISGLIGKRNKQNYKVKTPVATIGIRGTDYTANFCEQSCGVNGSGLYLSVASGGVRLSNDAGFMDVDAGQSGFVSSPSTTPKSLVSGNNPPASSDLPSSSNSLTGTQAENEQGNAVSLDAGNNAPALPQPEVPPVATGVEGRVVANIAGNLETGHNDSVNLQIDDNNEFRGFTSESGTTFNQVNSNPNSQGFDQTTGLYWGRWSNGALNVSNADGSSTESLENRSAHWVYTTNQITPVLPSTGTASFSLIGNTNPTDNQGNIGVLGTATLSADFTSQTVDADLNLTIDDRNWDASAEDVALDGSAATFAGDFDTVEITDNATGRETDGSGSLEGFFSGDENGELEGAGLVYSLEDGQGTEVDGAIAFEVSEIGTD